jgi:hypothetical protein
VKPYLSNNNKKKLGVVVCTWHPSYSGGRSRRIKIQASLGKNMRPYPKITNAKKKKK